MSRLITASLISSVDWMLNSPPSWKERAYKSLEDQLNRKWNEPTIAIKKGIAFENDIYNILEGRSSIDREQMSDNFLFFLDECNGGVFQDKDKLFIDIADEEYCLYVKEDVLFNKGHITYPNGHIQDIKTSGKWGGKSKYLNTYQHKLYCLVKEIPTFDYLVAIWEDAESESRKIKEVKKISYKVEDFAALKEEVIQKVADTISVLQSDDELWKAYTTKFSRY